MQIITITGPSGSGKSYLASLAASALGTEVHNLQLITDHAVDLYLRGAAARVDGTEPVVFFDEAYKKRNGDIFRDYLLDRYDDLRVRAVLIYEDLNS